MRARTAINGHAVPIGAEDAARYQDVVRKALRTRTGRGSAGPEDLGPLQRRKRRGDEGKLHALAQSGKYEECAKLIKKARNFERKVDLLESLSEGHRSDVFQYFEKSEVAKFKDALLGREVYTRAALG